MKKIKFKIENRKSIAVDLKDFCAFGKENDYLEITEWTNGEGYDITFSKEKGDLNLQLTYGELDALLKTYSFLNNEIIEE